MCIEIVGLGAAFRCNVDFKQSLFPGVRLFDEANPHFLNTLAGIISFVVRPQPGADTLLRSPHILDLVTIRKEIDSATFWSLFPKFLPYPTT